MVTSFRSGERLNIEFGGGRDFHWNELGVLGPEPGVEIKEEGEGVADGRSWLYVLFAAGQSPSFVSTTIPRGSPPSPTPATLRFIEASSFQILTYLTLREYT